MKLNDIGKNVKTACNWAFNNNGLEVDKSRIRLCDGSPVHSVGTTRLWSKWPYALAFAPLLASATLDESKLEPKDTVPVAIGSVLLLSLRRFDKTHYSALGLNVDTLCINKNPNKNTPPTSPKNIIRAKTIYSVSWTTSLATTPLIILTPEFLGTTVDKLRQAYTYKKVAKGDWVIEEISKPKVKEPKDIPLPEPDIA